MKIKKLSFEKVDENPRNKYVAEFTVWKSYDHHYSFNYEFDNEEECQTVFSFWFTLYFLGGDYTLLSEVDKKYFWRVRLGIAKERWYEMSLEELEQYGNDWFVSPTVKGQGFSVKVSYFTDTGLRLNVKVKDGAFTEEKTSEELYKEREL